MRISYTPRALADLTAIADYLKPLSAQGLANVRAHILRTLQYLVRHPRLGRLQSVENVRKIGIRKYPYFIYYIVDDDLNEIVILAVQHAARKQPYTDP